MSTSTNSNTKTTPWKGTFVYPHLNEPDTKYAKGGPGDYKTRFRDEGADHKAHYMKQMAAALEAFKTEERERINGDEKLTPIKRRAALDLLERPAHFPIKDVLDENTAEPTGAFELSFSIVAGGIAKKTGREYKNTVVIFDNSDPPKKVNVPVYNNAKGKVSYIIDPYCTETVIGVKLKPVAVQLIDLAPRAGEGGERDASAFGFGAEEGTFDPEAFGSGQSSGAGEEGIEQGSAGDANALL